MSSDQGPLLSSRSLANMSHPDVLSTLLPRALAERVVAGRGGLEGERKVVTVLFADLVGSTALASDFDPEDMVDLLNGVFARWVQAVHGYEGTVDKLLGDGMLALFGAPLVHEDDPRRAVLAALEIRDATREYAEELGHSLDVRVGLNTGTVALDYLTTSLELTEASAPWSPPTIMFRNGLATVHLSIGDAESARRRLDEARERSWSSTNSKR